MRKEFSVPLDEDVADTQTIPDYLYQRAITHPDAVVFETPSAGGWQAHRAKDVYDDVVRLAALLHRRGVGRGDRVAVMSRTRVEWSLLDLATWYLGAVVVPVYETSSAEQARWILTDAGCRLAAVETRDLKDTLARAARLEGGHPATDVLVIDDGDLQGPDPSPAERDWLVANFERRSLSDAATIIYTSGTTGRPKGVTLTQANFVLLSAGALRDLKEVVDGDDVRTLLFLPMAHVFGRILSVLAVIKGVPLGHSPEPAKAVADITTFKPTFLMSVPRIWEKVYTAAEQKQGGGAKRQVFIWAVRTAIAYSRALDRGRPGAALRVQHALADRLVLSKVRAALGGDLKYAISGGAPLGERLGHFYRGAGLIMLEGYGLTETTAPLTVNRPASVRIGTVGYPLPGTSIAIDDDGEILAKGVGVFDSYHGNAEASAQATRDGWFATGDLGDMDEAGFVTITGRKKEIIVTAAGKNVAPNQLEDQLRVHPLISQCMVVGDGRPFVGVLITLDRDMMPIWLKNKGIEDLTVEEAKRHPVVLARLQLAIDRANEGVSRAESIRAMRILDGDFTVEGGELTPSLKVKRHVVADRYAHDIEALYADAASRRATEANGA